MYPLVVLIVLPLAVNRPVPLCYNGGGVTVLLSIVSSDFFFWWWCYRFAGNRPVPRFLCCGVASYWQPTRPTLLLVVVIPLAGNRPVPLCICCWCYPLLAIDPSQIANDGGVPAYSRSSRPTSLLVGGVTALPTIVFQTSRLRNSQDATVTEMAAKSERTAARIMGETDAFVMETVRRGKTVSFVSLRSARAARTVLFEACYEQ